MGSSADHEDDFDRRKGSTTGSCKHGVNVGWTCKQCLTKERDTLAAEVKAQAAEIERLKKYGERIVRLSVEDYQKDTARIVELQDQLAATQEELDDWNKEVGKVHEDSEGPATPQSTREFIKYLQKEWDDTHSMYAAERQRAERLQDEHEKAMAAVSAVREVITHLYYGEDCIHPSLSREQLKALSAADLKLRDEGFPSNEELRKWHTGRIKEAEQRAEKAEAECERLRALRGDLLGDNHSLMERIRELEEVLDLLIGRVTMAHNALSFKIEEPYPTVVRYLLEGLIRAGATLTPTKQPEEESAFWKTVIEMSEQQRKVDPQLRTMSGVEKGEFRTPKQPDTPTTTEETRIAATGHAPDCARPFSTDSCDCGYLDALSAEEEKPHDD